MQWKLDKDRAVCPQICEQVCLRIALGEFAAGEKLLSVREVALAAGVNPNTVQHSFDILERKGMTARAMPKSTPNRWMSICRLR